MHFEFEEHLKENLQEPAKQVAESNALGESMSDNVVTEVSQKIAREVKLTGSTIQAEHEIFDLQIEKQRLMNELRGKLALLDHPEELTVLSEGTPVTTDGMQLFVEYEGRELRLSQGDIANAPRWGHELALHNNLPRLCVKRHLIAQTKMKLQHLLDEQIVTREWARGHNQAGVDHRKLEGFQGALDGRTESNKLGFISERIAVSFLNRLSLDYNLGFSVDEADVYDDVERKIDFYISHHRHEREVSIEGHGSREERTGIQFTISNQPQSIERKNQQLDRVRPSLQDEGVVHDLLLVQVPEDISQEFRYAIQDMQACGLPLSPDRLVNPLLLKRIFTGFLDQMYSEEELAEMWKIVQEGEGLKEPELLAA